VKVLLDLKLSATLKERERERERERESLFLFDDLSIVSFFSLRRLVDLPVWPRRFQLLYILLYSWILEGVVHLEEWRTIS
jgi:hypothetical protein